VTDLIRQLPVQFIFEFNSETTIKTGLQVQKLSSK